MSPQFSTDGINVTSSPSQTVGDTGVTISSGVGFTVRRIVTTLSQSPSTVFNVTVLVPASANWTPFHVRGSLSEHTVLSTVRA